jgi:hypothetical protein
LPSANVTKIKTLLNDGWRMTAHEMRFSAVEGIERDHVILEKGNETTFIESENDAEFFEYIHHFERFEDGFGNYQFVYVEDINGYKQKIQELIEQGTVPKKPYQITVGELVLDSPFLYYLVTPRYGGAHLGQAYFFVNIRKNPDFFKIDYRDPIKIKWLDSNELAFNGFAHEVNVSEESALFLCIGGPRRFFEGRVNCELIGLTPQDAIYFMVKSANMNMVFDGGPKPLLVKRAFNVIFPVAGLKLPSEFTIEQVLFTNDINKFLTNKIKGSKTIGNYPWQGISSFAVVEVTAEHYIEALNKAEEVAKRAVDWIQFRTDISLPSISNEGKRIMLSYNMSKAFSKCRLIPYGLAIDSATKGAVFNLLNVQSGHSLVFHHSPQDFFDPLIPTLDKLAQLNTQYSENVQPLYETLSWLMQSFEIESLVDNLLQLWIAFEFICTNEKVTKLVADTSISTSILAVQGIALPAAEKTALVESVKRVNDPPLMVKWQSLLRRLDVSLTDEEQQLVRRLRTERNNLIHGKKSCKLTIDDLEKFRSILERVFIKKTAVLIESHYGIQNLSFLFEY